MCLCEITRKQKFNTRIVEAYKVFKAPKYGEKHGTDNQGNISKVLMETRCGL